MRRRGGGVGDRLREADAHALAAPVACRVPEHGPLGTLGDAGHHLDRLGRVVARGRLRREHDGIRTVEDRRRDVRDLRARRADVRHHRLEHLGGDDHRHAGRARLPDDLLLDQRHVLQRHVHAQVPARDHHRVDRFEDAGKVGDRLVALELGDERDPRAERREIVTDLGDVGRRADERHGHEVDAVLDAEAKVLAVLVRQARRRERDARERDALVVADAPAHDHAADDLLRRGPLDAELEHPVVHPDLVAGPDVREVLGVVQRGALGRALHGTRAQRERPVGDEVHATPARRAEGAEADLRPLEVLEDRHGPAPARLALADQPDGRRVLVGAAVREVDARDVHARRDEPIEGVRAAAGRAERADDLGPPHRGYPAFSSGRRNRPV